MSPQPWLEPTVILVGPSCLFRYARTRDSVSEGHATRVCSGTPAHEIVLAKDMLQSSLLCLSEPASKPRRSRFETVGREYREKESFTRRKS